MDAEKVIKALEWLIINFPKQENPKDDSDRFCNCINLYCQDAVDLIKRQQAEIEALINGQETLQKMCAEAYKYFAERLEDISSERLVFEGYGENRVVNVVEYGDIVNLVKELTEGSNDTRRMD